MAALLAQSVALRHAEAVLLVDDGQPQPLVRHILLNQRVRADGDGGLPAGERITRGGALLRPHGRQSATR